MQMLKELKRKKGKQNLYQGKKNMFSCLDDTNYHREF